jgi:hypothetical protein
MDAGNILVLVLIAALLALLFACELHCRRNATRNERKPDPHQATGPARADRGPGDCEIRERENKAA